jgi:hypothetical protein
VTPLVSGGSAVVVTPNTDYYLTFSDEQSARMVSACVYEVSLTADTANGYLSSGAVAGGPIFDSDRQGNIQALRTAWQKNAAGLWYYTSETDATAFTNATNTNKNLADSTLTLPVAASHPGVTIDLTNKARLRNAAVGVSFSMYVFGSRTVSAGGTVGLYNGAGTLVTSVSGFGTTPAWLSVGNVFLPASSDTYRLYAANGGANTITVNAVTLLQLE